MTPSFLRYATPVGRLPAPPMLMFNRITQIETDLKPYAEAQKASWIMNGNVEAEWDAYIEHLNQLNLQELLDLKQAGLDTYFANMG